MLTKEEYEEKRQARYDRLINAANRASAESEAAHNESDRISSQIPLGQPILVGHHSEGRHRRALETIRNKARKGYELAKKAEEYRSRAASVEANEAIFSDDPEAVEKLGGKIAQLEARQERMKAANKLIRKNDRAGLAAMGYSDKQIEKLFTPDSCRRFGYPDYAITNNGANIRRLKQRAQIVEKKQAQADREETINGIKIEYSPSENRIRVFYPARVALETFKALKSHGFRVLRSAGEGAFSAYYNSNALYFIRTNIKA